MHRQLDWRLWTVLGVGLTSACLHGPSNAQVVRERMAEEYNCHQGEMVVTEFIANGYQVTGCGLTASYDCSVGRYNVLTCAKEAGSSPVPTVAQDAGTQ